MQLNEEKLNAFLGKMVNDLSGAFSVALVRMGDQLGFYKILHEKGPLTSQELADHSRMAERYVREWLAHQFVSDYLDYDPESGKFSLSPENALVFAIEDSPAFMIGAFDTAVAALESAPKVQAAFHTGEGVSWGDHSTCLFCAVQRFFHPGYVNNLVQAWLPALDGVAAKLEHGARVADVGCGHGLTTVLMAKAFPNAHFYGFDFHSGSIAHARDLAREHGVEANTTFEVALAKNYPGTDYDLVCMFDCLHDMGDPVGAAQHVKTTLAADGTYMVVEPLAADRLEDNVNPLRSISYAASTLVCVPTSLAQEVGLALGAVAGEKRLTEVLNAGGFATVRRAAETPSNMVLEVR